MASGETRRPDEDDEEEAAIRRSLAASPEDRDARAVYADWLEEKGYAERAAEMRAWLASPAPCLTCAHFEWSWLGGDRCDAFAGGIPREILLGRVLHDTPYEGDGGLQYAPAGSPNAGAERRHDAWGRAPLRRALRSGDPLGEIVDHLERGGAPRELGPSPADARVRQAWLTTEDAISALMVSLRTGREAVAIRALERARQRLDLEQCDALDDKGWLGAQLTLVDVAQRLERGQLAGLAGRLAAAYRTDYVEARLHRCILHALRLDWPTGPSLDDLEQWAGAPDLGWTEHPSYLQVAGPARGGVAPT